jgi:hypothetical protein
MKFIMAKPTRNRRVRTLLSISQRRQKLQSKNDRAYDDYLEGRVSEAQWTRKSAEWESELATTDAELSRLTTAAPTDVATGEKILELAKTAHLRYVEQSPAEQRRLLDIVLSDCTLAEANKKGQLSFPFLELESRELFETEVRNNHQIYGGP